MSVQRQINRFIAVASIALSPAVALAGAPVASIHVSPASLVSSVPTVSENLLIVLGLLLAVIAIRTLRAKAGQRLLSIAVLGGGLVLGGIGIERTVASGPPVDVSNGACRTGGVLTYNPEDYGYIRNLCPNTIRIDGYESEYCPLNIASSGCPIDTILQPEGEKGSSCGPLPQCTLQ